MPNKEIVVNEQISNALHMRHTPTVGSYVPPTKCARAVLHQSDASHTHSIFVRLGILFSGSDFLLTDRYFALCNSYNFRFNIFSVGSTARSNENVCTSSFTDLCCRHWHLEVAFHLRKHIVRAFMASLTDPIAPQQSQNPPKIVLWETSELMKVEELYKAHLVQNLEVLLVGHPTDTKWPNDIKEVIADTILRGRFKYHDENNRIYRVDHHLTLTAGTPTQTPPAEPDESETFHKKRIYSVYLSVRIALQFLSSNEVFKSDIHQWLEWQELASQLRLEIDPTAPNSLGVVSDIVYDVCTQSRRPALEIIDILMTSFTGIPCILPPVLFAGVGSSHTDLKMISCGIILAVLVHLNEASVKHVNPGSRWKQMHLVRLAYLHGILRKHGHCYVNDDAFYVLSKLDMCHVVVETGLALRVGNRKICYAAPQSLTLLLATSIAGTKTTEEEWRIFELSLTENEFGQEKWFLLREDWEDRQNEKNSVHQYWEWTSISITSPPFAPQTLTDFVTRETRHKNRVATNARGDVLFYVDHIGPWHWPKHLPARYESYQELMRGTVQGYPVQDTSYHWFPWVSKRKTSMPVEKASLTTTLAASDSFPIKKDFEVCSYKPKTLEAVRNKPGRVLVKRKGVRGLGGRFIAASILVLGIISVLLNFAHRDNWLEVAFDGAQVMSLIAGLILAIVYIINGTLTSTLDWLGGFTEVTDDIQLAQALGVGLDELKVACTYEKEFLFWLSEVNSCFCPAGKYGTIMFTEPFDMKQAEGYVKHCSVIDKEHGLWLLQGWAFRIEKQGDIGHMIKVPYEDRVYVDEREIIKFA